MRDIDRHKKELVDELVELRQRFTEFEVVETERRRVKEQLQKRTHNLGERVKELNCLYGISSAAKG